jgi:hypothetical protein
MFTSFWGTTMIFRIVLPAMNCVQVARFACGHSQLVANKPDPHIKNFSFFLKELSFAYELLME